MNTDTPRTDAVLNTFDGKASKLAADLATHAEKLERELTAVTEQRDRLAEALRKAISWGDSASHHILYREKINWTYLNEAREALQSLTTNEL